MDYFDTKNKIPDGVSRLTLRFAVTGLWYVLDKTKMKTCSRLLMEPCSSCHSRVVLLALFSTTAGSVSLGMPGLSVKKSDQLCSLFIEVFLFSIFHRNPVLLK